MRLFENFVTIVQVAQAGPFWLLSSLGALLAMALLYGAQRSLSHKRMFENIPTALISSV